jgi:hypothetical protein
MENLGKPDDLPQTYWKELYSKAMSTLGLPNHFQWLSNEPKLMVSHA